MTRHGKRPDGVSPASVESKKIFQEICNNAAEKMHPTRSYTTIKTTFRPITSKNNNTSLDQLFKSYRLDVATSNLERWLTRYSIYDFCNMVSSSQWAEVTHVVATSKRCAICLLICNVTFRSVEEHWEQGFLLEWPMSFRLHNTPC
jgi:hypothetical protein